MGRGPELTARPYPGIASDRCSRCSAANVEVGSFVDEVADLGQTVDHYLAWANESVRLLRRDR